MAYSYDVCAVEEEEEVAEPETEEPEEEEEEEEGEGEDEEEEEEGEEEEEEEEPVVEEDCSCIVTQTNEVKWDEDGTHYIEVVIDEVTYKYEPNFGLTECMAWDGDVEPYCADEDGMPLEDAPVWCANQFCYVNPETCTTPRVRKSNYFEDYYYSYEACGDVDVFGDEGELCPGVEETEDVWWNDFLTRFICPQVMDRVDAEFEAAQAADEEATEEVTSE